MQEWNFLSKVELALNLKSFIVETVGILLRKKDEFSSEFIMILHVLQYRKMKS